MKRTNEFQRYIDFRWAQLGYDDKKLKEFVDSNAPKGVNFDTDFDAFIQICHQDFYVNKDNISMRRKNKGRNALEVLKKAVEGKVT